MAAAANGVGLAVMAWPAPARAAAATANHVVARNRVRKVNRGRAAIPSIVAMEGCQKWHQNAEEANAQRPRIPSTTMEMKHATTASTTTVMTVSEFKDGIQVIPRFREMQTQARGRRSRRRNGRAYGPTMKVYVGK
ncbi:MAG: hypothetical protein HYX69_02755 [Planctomycetia bacterium]|nr:hypothetical protein [Planctomycetia bacterium]